MFFAFLPPSTISTWSLVVIRFIIYFDSYCLKWNFCDGWTYCWICRTSLGLLIETVILIWLVAWNSLRFYGFGRWQKTFTNLVSSVILAQRLTAFHRGLICMWVTLFFHWQLWLTLCCLETINALYGILVVQLGRGGLASNTWIGELVA